MYGFGKRGARTLRGEVRDVLPQRRGGLDAADTDDNGALEITDAVYLLSFLFLGGPAPEQPFPSCGPDPTIDDLTCESFAICDEP